TERKQYELDLLESEQRFRTIFEKAIDGIIIFNLDGILLDLNQAFAGMHGRTREEMLGMNIRDLNNAETNALVPERLRRLVGGDTLKIELNQIHRDGHEFQTEATACLVSYGGQPAILSFHRDITERKRAELAAAKAAMEWNAALDASPDVVYLLDLDRRILRANRAFFLATGVSPEAALGRPITDLIHPEGEAVPCPVCRAQEGRQDLRMVMEADHPDNPIHLPLEISLKVVKDAAGAPISLLMTLRDLTATRKEMEERAALERQLQHAQKMESLGTLAGGIAHDMNNVLGAILGLASAQLEMLPPGTPAQRAFETIAKAATRGGDMVRSLLSFARQNRVETRELDLNAVLREEARLLERTTLSRVRLVLDLDPNLQAIRGDETALAHAIMNLCVNAVDAMPEGGTLTLATRNAGEGWVEACVQDTGAGMTREVLERATEPFYTTKGVGKGTGLGLAMVYSTLKSHQGLLDLQSAPGEGTTVRLRLPACAKGHSERATAPPPKPQPSTRSLSVLLVDDDELVRNATETLLEVAGHQVVQAEDGETALRSLEAGLSPDLVILDLNMPGLGGAETLPRLRELLPDVAVLLATGRVDQAALDLVARYRCTGLLSKPFTMQDLQQQVAALLA
ncbi:MAG TPA: PAS domain S-box protein, partial [Holophagaceae bacterium]